MKAWFTIYDIRYIYAGREIVQTIKNITSLVLGQKKSAQVRFSINPFMKEGG